MTAQADVPTYPQLCHPHAVRWACLLVAGLFCSEVVCVVSPPAREQRCTAAPTTTRQPVAP